MGTLVEKVTWNLKQGVFEKMAFEKGLEEGDGVTHEVEGYLGNLAPGRGES